MTFAKPLSAITFSTLVLVAGSQALAADSVLATSNADTAQSCKVQSILMVGTSALNTDAALGNKQALIGAEVRKLLKVAGIPVSPVGVKLGESDLASFVAAALAKSPSTHILTITVPSGTVLVKRSTGETIAARRYVVNAQLAETKQGQVVWSYSGEIEAGLFLSASNAQVAESIVARAQADGCI